MPKCCRLSKSVLPTEYEIVLQVDFNKATIEGHAEISIMINKSTKVLALNSVGIEISMATFKSDIQAFDDVRVSYNAEEETVSLTFQTDLRSGSGTLCLDFICQLTETARGFYKSMNFNKSEKSQKFNAVTQFKPAYARLAFPCFDEPAFKATFSITLVVPKDKVALSNMAGSEFKDVTFEKSPVMPSYLVAMVVGDFDVIESRVSDVLVRVYAPPGKKDQGQYALNGETGIYLTGFMISFKVANDALSYFKGFFNIPFPLPKVELVALADTESVSGNWGLVMFREASLLIEDSNSDAAKPLVALTVARAIACQWFGNIATLKWWNNLWYFEAVVTWLQYVFVDSAYPEFEIMSEFFRSEFATALRLDAFTDSHPVEVSVDHPSEVIKACDELSVCKGTAIIKMIYNYIGEADFKTGMHLFLSKHKHRVATTENLWDALSEASGKNINSFASAWTLKSGYPMITVNQSFQESTRKLYLKQKRFLADGTVTSGLWMVPIAIISESAKDTIYSFVLDRKRSDVELGDIGREEWIKLAAGVGFYRISYEDKMLKTLLPLLKNKTLPPQDRLALQNDIFALSRAGIIKVTEVLKMIEVFGNETDYGAWKDFSACVGSLFRLYQNTDCFDNFKSLLKRPYESVARNTGLETNRIEAPTASMIRVSAVSGLAMTDDDQLMIEARKKFKKICEGSDRVIGELKGVICGIALRQSLEDDLRCLLKIYTTSERQDERIEILKGLGWSDDQDIINLVLDLSIGVLSPELAPHNTVPGVAAVTGSLRGQEMAWNFVKNRWVEINRRHSPCVVAEIIRAATENFATKTQARDVALFLRKHPLPGMGDKFKQIKEQISLNIAQLKRDIAPLKTFLSLYECR